LKDAVILIFANKQDLPNSMTPYELAVGLGLRETTLKYQKPVARHRYRHHDVDLKHVLENRFWCIQPCAATTGDGLYEGFDWVSTLLGTRK